MVDTLTWVLVGIAVYWVGVIGLRRLDLLPDSIGTQGPILTLHTKRGRAFLNWLAGPRRFWRAWANVGVGISLVVMVGAFLVLLTSAVSSLRNPEPTAVNQPRNVLVIPGVNDFLPLSVAPEIVFGLAVGLIVHEGGHGLLCRVEDIDIESMGLVFFAILPIGAFVQPDTDREGAAGPWIRMFAAGPASNLVVAALTFAVLLLLLGAITPVAGVAVGGVFADSPAAEAGLDRGDVVTGLDGQPIGNESQLDAALDAGGGTVRVQRAEGPAVTVERRVTVVRATGPIDLTEGATIRAVNGTAVGTETHRRLGGEEGTLVALGEPGSDRLGR